jgi:hypothetical protein
MSSYAYQIRLLENQLKQLESGTDNKDLQKMADIVNQLRRLRRQEWEEKHETIDLGDDR